MENYAPTLVLTRSGTQVPAEVATESMHLSYGSESEVGGKSVRKGNFPTVI